MGETFFLAFTLLAGFILTAPPVSAQLTITIPKIPKIRREKKDSSKDSSQNSAAGNTTGNNQTGQSANDNQNTSGTRTDDGNSSKSQEKQPTLLSFYLSDIGKAQEMVDNFTPGCCIYFVDAARGEWLLKAVSPKALQVWLPKDKEFAAWRTKHPDNKVDQALAALAAAAVQKLPGYKPDPQKLAFHNPVQEKMLESKLNNLATLKIIKTGLTHAAWQIDKNDLGIPTDRYKWGIIWARDTADDHPYCHIYHINLIQDYAGGDTYGAVYARFISDELAGCQQ